MSVPLLAPDQTDLVEAVARRVVELLDERQRPAAQLVDATTLGRMFGVSRSTIYEHKDLLGGVELGQGSRQLVRFDVERARAAWSPCVSGEKSHGPEAPESAPLLRAPRKRRGTAARSNTGLLPVKGQEAA